MHAGPADGGTHCGSVSDRRGGRTRTQAAGAAQAAFSEIAIMKRKSFLPFSSSCRVFVGGLAGVKALQIKKLIAAGKAFVPPPETVSTAVAREEKWQGILTAIGSITAVQGVTVTPEIPGTVREIAFESGAVVAKGDLLVRLDTSSEEAQLRASKRRSSWPRLNLTASRKSADGQHGFAVGTGRRRGRREAVPGQRRRDPRHDREEDHPRAVRRAAGHPPGQPGPVPGHGQTDRLAPVARRRCMRISRCRSRSWPGSRPACACG